MQEPIDRSRQFLSGSTAVEHGITIEQPHSAAMHYVALCLCGWNSRPALTRGDVNTEAHAHIATGATHSASTPADYRDAFYPQLEYAHRDADPLIGPCPPWCVTGPHMVEMSDEDRHHGGELLKVIVSDLPAEINAPGTENWSTTLGHVQMYLTQRRNDAEPTVRVDLNDSHIGVVLRLGEAELLARALLRMVEAAR